MRVLNGGYKRFQRTLAAATRWHSRQKSLAGLASHVLFNQ
jgi:hypothetical protein